MALISTIMFFVATVSTIFGFVELLTGEIFFAVMLYISAAIVFIFLIVRYFNNKEEYGELINESKYSDSAIEFNEKLDKIAEKHRGEITFPWDLNKLKVQAKPEADESAKAPEAKAEESVVESTAVTEYVYKPEIITSKLTAYEQTKRIYSQIIQSLEEKNYG